MKFSIIVAAALFAAPAFADRDIDCNSNDLPQQMMNRCASMDFEASDRRLNEAYSRLMASLDAGSREKLKAAQRNWIQFRDNECTFETVDNEGGTLHPLVYAGCLKRLTDARIRELNTMLRCQSNAARCGM